MANHDPRQSPLQFIDIPASSGLVPHPTYASMHSSLTTGLGIGPSTPVRLRPSSVPHRVSNAQSASLAPGGLSRGPIGYHPSPQPSQMMLQAQQPLSVVTNMGMGHHRSNSAQNIQAMMRDRSMENMGGLGRLPPGMSATTPSGGLPNYNADLDRPRPASARDHPFSDIGMAPIGSEFGTTPRRLREQHSYSPRTSSLERGAAGGGGGGGGGTRHFSGGGGGGGNPGRMPGGVLRHQRSHSYDFNLDRDPLGMQAPPPPHAMPAMGLGFPNDIGVGLGVVGAPPPMMPDYGATDAATLHRECMRLQQELELTKEKLSSCMNSIKTFWSPELKRERALRKEENAKYAVLADQLHQAQMEKQSMLATLQSFEIELRRERELRAKASYSSQEYELLRRRCEELQKENRIFAKSQEELETRWAGQKQTLAAREESIRKLLDMLHGKGHRMDRIEEDRVEIERLQSQLYDYSCRVRDLERLLIERDSEIARTREELDSTMGELAQWKKEAESLRHETRQTQNIQSMLDTKDSKILTLESEIRLLEEELGRLRDDGIVTPTTSISSGIEDFDKIIHTLKSNERLLKSKMEMTSTELSKRDSEVYALQSRLEMSQKQQQDQTHHINVLKEQVKTREHKISMLTADIEDLRKRVKEKESAVDKKIKQMTSVQGERKQLEVEIKELKDQMDIKDRKVLVLQKKIENLEELLADKENQLSTAKSRLSNLHSEHSSTAGARAGLEETIRERERQVERLKDQKARSEADHQAEVEMQKKTNSELRARLDSVQKELDEKHSAVLELREELSELKSDKFKKETEINQLQSQMSQKSAELSSLQMEYQLSKKQFLNEAEFKANQRINDLECQVSHYMESAGKLQAEVDRLLNAMRNQDLERSEKERHIAEMEEQLKEVTSKMNSMKRVQQTDRKKHAQMLEEARRREEHINVDTDYLKSSNEEKDSRIRELEMTLKESVKLTAEREMLLANKEDINRQLEQQVLDARQQIDLHQRERASLNTQLSSVQEDLRDKEEQLKALENECFQGYIPELEKLRKMNQEASVRMTTLMKIIQGKESTLSEADRMNLHSISLFGDTALKQTSSISAFEKMQGPTTEVGRLNRLLQEKQQLLNQQMEELAGIRFQNSELEARVKNLQRELEEKSKQSAYMESHQATIATTTAELTQLRQTNMDLNTKLMQLRKELEEKEERARMLQSDCFSAQLAEIESLKQRNGELSSCVLEKEAKLRNQFVELERVKQELNKTVTDRDAHMSILSNDLERLKKEKIDMNNSLMQFQQEIREKTDRVRNLEADQTKRTMDMEALQKKYQTVLSQFSERNDRVQQLEKECFQVGDEAKRLRTEKEEMNHRLTYTQKSLNDRDAKLEQTDKELFKLREELSQLRKQYHCADAELKTLREELAYREDRIKQMQSSHNDEIKRLRSINQEANSRSVEMKNHLDEKEIQLKSMHSDNESLRSELEHMRRRVKDSESQVSRISSEIALKEERVKSLENEVHRIQTEDVQRLQKASDEFQTRLNTTQKRLDEREARLRKVENENRDLLDEIHGLRKRNYELESQLDMARSSFMDKDEVMPSRSSSSMDIGYSSQASSIYNVELERLRKQYSEASTNASQLQTLLQDAQIRCDQVAQERDLIRIQMEDERTKVQQMQQFMQERENEYRKREAEIMQTKQSEDQRLVSAKMEHMGQIQREKEVQAQQQRQKEMHMQKEVEVRDSQLQQLSREIENSMRQNHELTRRAETAEQVAAEATMRLEKYVADHEDLKQSREIVRQEREQQGHELQQTQHMSEKMRKELTEAKQHVTGLTRQMQELQMRCDGLGQERDALRRALQEAQDNSGNATSNLSRELERLHHERNELASHMQKLAGEKEDLQQEMARRDQEFKMRLSQETQRTRGHQDENKAEVELKDRQLQQLQGDAERLHKQNQQLEQAVFEANEKMNVYKQQCEEMHAAFENNRQSETSKVSDLQQTLQQREAEVQHLKQILEHSKQEFKKMEAHFSRRKSQDITQQKETQEAIAEMNRQVELKENQIRQLTGQLERSSMEVNEQESIIRQLSDRLEQTLQQSANRGPQHPQLPQQQRNPAAEEAVRTLQQELGTTKRALQERDQRIQKLEQECFQQQAEEIERLRREIRNLSTGAPGGGPPPHGGPPGNGVVSPQEVASLKAEIDALKRELNAKVDQIAAMERDCAEKHVRRIETLQTKLKRNEEEMGNMHRGLEEQRRAIEERDRMIKQMRSDQHHATSMDLEQLRAEHSHCQEQLRRAGQEIGHKDRMIRTLEGQLDKQLEEVLEMKQEALTASICEKDANIALVEMTGVKNAHTNQTIQKLQDEKGKLTTQLKQLAQTRAKLQEQSKEKEKQRQQQQQRQ